MVPQLPAQARREGAGCARISVVSRGPKLPVHVDPDREFDRTSLREQVSGLLVHRDYAAHFFRWGFAGRFSNHDVTILDVGCGLDAPLCKVLQSPQPNYPKRYVGVDLNGAPRSYPQYSWAQFRWGFNFLARWNELESFDLVICFEVIEHMRRPEGVKLLRCLHECLNLNGTLLLSTPVFNGKAAYNHLHEWTVPDLFRELKSAGFRVVRRFGTFGNVSTLRKAITPEERDLMTRLSEYYSNDVLACFLAPLYPDQSRNNIWQLEHA